jgi:SAM-dependent methyltransferase
MSTQWRRANLQSWEIRAALHARDATGFYDVAGFLSGKDQLLSIEAAEIGDVAAKRLVHLQCHFGMETLCLARRGASATGLDFSATAIAAARDLADRSGVPATFVEADVYEAREALEGHFDVAYVTWGTITWLPDIRRWGAVVASLLKPGGFLYLADSHPATLVLEEQEGRFEPTYGWRTPPDSPDRFVKTETYTGDALPGPSETFNWIHPLSDIVAGLLDAGLRLEFLHEHEALPWRLFPSMVRGPDGLFRLPEGSVRLPLSFSLRARKPEKTESAFEGQA